MAALFGAIHKLRRQARGRGVCKMSMVLHNISLCSKLVCEGGGGGVKNPQNSVYVVYERLFLLCNRMLWQLDDHNDIIR